MNLYRLTNLKLFHTSGAKCSAEDTEKMAKRLINLEVLTIDDPPIDIILAFIRHTKKLKKIFASNIMPNNRCLDLFALKSQYLLTKWSNTDMDLSHTFE